MRGVCLKEEHVGRFSQVEEDRTDPITIFQDTKPVMSNRAKSGSIRSVRHKTPLEIRN